MSEIVIALICFVVLLFTGLPLYVNLGLSSFLYMYLGGENLMIVAQRITSVVDADKILVIENGKITEEGTHEQLVENGGYYTSIYNISQQGSSEVIQ